MSARIDEVREMPAQQPTSCPKLLDLSKLPELFVTEVAGSILFLSCESVLQTPVSFVELGN